MAVYSATATAACASNAAKVAIQLATGTTTVNKWVAFDVSFNGTTATATPILVEVVRTTGVSSGGGAYTPLKYQAEASSAATSTARVNDTADGSSPTIVAGWYVPTTSGFSYQWPLGREFTMAVSTWAEIRITTVTASGTPTYVCNLQFEE